MVQPNWKQWGLDQINYGRWIDPGTYEGGTARDRREERERLARDIALRADVQHMLIHRDPNLSRTKTFQVKGNMRHYSDGGPVRFI